MAGGWAAQFTIYPIYADIAPLGAEAFHVFSRGYLSRIALVLPPVGVIAGMGVDVMVPLSQRAATHSVAIVGLCIAFVAVTPFAAIAQEQMQDHGFSESLYARLMWSNAIRAVLFTAIGLLSLIAVRSLWTKRQDNESGA